MTFLYTLDNYICFIGLLIIVLHLILYISLLENCPLKFYHFV